MDINAGFKIILITIGMALIFGLAGCGSDIPSPDDTPSATTPSAPITVTHAYRGFGSEN